MKIAMLKAVRNSEVAILRLIALQWGKRKFALPPLMADTRNHEHAVDSDDAVAPARKKLGLPGGLGLWGGLEVNLPIDSQTTGQQPFMKGLCHMPHKP